MKKGSYTDLKVFQQAYDLSLAIHRVSLEFPKIEQFGGIADQLRRSSKSVCANLVEGYAKQSKSKPEFIRFLWMAIGSMDETKLWIQYAHDLGYLQTKTHDEWTGQCQIIAAQMTKLAAHRLHNYLLSDVRCPLS